VSTASNSRKHPFLDALYGPVEFNDDLLALVRTPTLQRLRHVRLSNIDSIDMPSIANLSRLEHVIGVAYLAGEVGFRTSMTSFELLAFRAAALLHDWAITSFGHLVEEALQYVGTRFEHEERLREIMTNGNAPEVGGLDMQILVGRESGLRGWARRAVGAQRGEDLLRDIMETIRGQGRWGRAIAGDIDLDNIDNVFRMAYHLGLEADRAVPVRLARAIMRVSPDRGEPVFRRDAEPDVEAWREARRQVYNHLMLAERDFAGKVMMLSAAVGAYEAGEFTQTDWSYVDHQVIMLLLSSRTKDVRETAERWIAGELWDCTPLRWMRGDRPGYADLRAFSRAVGTTLGRPCFAYAIKDKRDRRLAITYDDGTQGTYGDNARQWLLGIGSPKREAFTQSQVTQAFALAADTFGTSVIAPDANHSLARVDRTSQACLF
jgi:HD superfamily phosphohydrolase